MTAIKRVRGQGKDFTAVYCGPNAQPFEVTETPEDFGIALKSESDAGASS
jgi:hypothetical protein